MSWFKNLIPKKNLDNGNVGENKNKTHLYISLEFTRVCFLLIDESVNPKKILSYKEVYTGPFEDLQKGMPVRDFSGVIEKILTSEKENFLGNLNDISVSLPASGVFFKTIEVAKMDNENTQKLLLSEIKNSLPIDFSEVLLAQNDLGEKHENKTTFFCVLIQKNVYENIKNIFAKFGIDPYFEIEVFSLARIAERNDNYKLLVHVGKTNCYLIFLFGQIVQQVEVIDMGDNKINDEINKFTKIDYPNILMLRENLEILQTEAKFSSQIILEFIKDFNTILSKAIALHILEFEKKFLCEIKELIISGVDASNRLKKTIHEEFDAEIKVDFINENNFESFVAENFQEDNLKRYAQCFGLAKRVK